MPDASTTRLARYAAILKRTPRYPVWSVRSAVTMLLIVAGISGIVVGLVPDLKIIARIELTLAVCALSLFWLMAHGLYRGARVKRKSLPSSSYESSVTVEDAVNTTADIPPDLAVEAGAEGGLIGILVALVLWLLVTLFAGFVLWALLQFGGALIVGFIFGLSWVVYRALRQVFALSRRTQGKILMSVGYAAFYTIMYTGWLFALLHLAQWLRG